MYLVANPEDGFSCFITSIGKTFSNGLTLYILVQESECSTLLKCIPGSNILVLVRHCLYIYVTFT